MEQVPVSDTRAGVERLHSVHGRFKRGLLGAFGLFALVVPVWEFRDILLQPSLLVLPFWVILIGAWGVGGLFLAGALLADDVDLRIAPDGITLDLRNPLRHSQRSLRAEEVAEVTVRTVVWDSSADSYVAEVRLADGRRLSSGDFTRRELAEDLARRLSAALARA